MPRGRPRYEGPLTPREWDVLHLLEEGLTNEEIAARLGISFAGARYHVAEIISKLAVSSRYEAVEWAREQQVAQKPRPGIALLLQRMLLTREAAAVAAIAVAIAATAIFFVFQGENGSAVQDDVLPQHVAIDGQTAEQFLQSIQPAAPLETGEVLYTRVEVYERHGPKSPQITAANGIPAEHYIRESWVQAGPDDAFVRAFVLISDESGEPILVTATASGISRIIELPSGRLFRQDDVPGGMKVIGDNAGRAQQFLTGIRTGEITVVGQTQSGILLEEMHDQAFYERVLIEGRGLTEEQKEARRAKFFQRDMSPDGFGVPYYGDLNAVALVTHLNIDAKGMTTHQETRIRTQTGETIVVASSIVTNHEVVDAIPPEVIALTR